MQFESTLEYAEHLDNQDPLYTLKDKFHFHLPIQFTFVDIHLAYNQYKPMIMLKMNSMHGKN